MSEYTPPSFGGRAFNCPHCGAYAQQDWAGLIGEPSPWSEGGKLVPPVDCEHLCRM